MRGGTRLEEARVVRGGTCDGVESCVMRGGSDEGGACDEGLGRGDEGRRM